MPGKRGGAERPRTRHARRKTREAREPGGRGGGGRALARPGDPAAPPVPRRGRDARSRARSRSTKVAAHRRHRAEGRGGGGRGRRSPLSLHPRTRPPPPRARPPRGGLHHGQGHTADGRRAPSASGHHTRPRGAGDAGRRGHGDRPAVGKTGDPTRARASAPERGAAAGRGRGEDHGSSPSSSTRRRRRTGGGETGNGSGPRRARKRDTPGRGPGRQQTASGLRRTDRRRGAPTGCGHARPTPRNRGGVGGAAARHREGHGSKRPVLGQGEARVGRQGPPRDLTARGLPAQGRSHRTPGTTDWRPPGTLTGAHAHRHRHTPESRKPARENALPPRTGGPHRPPHAQGSPRAAPPRGRHRPTEAGGRHPHEARPARPQTGEGSAGRSHARDEEERPATAGRGRQARTAGAAGQGRGRHPGTTKTPGTRPGHQENQRGVPPPPTHEGGPATRLGRRPVPASPRAGPHDPAPPPGPASRPNPSSAIRPRQIRLPISVCHPEARHPGDHALERGGPDRDRTPPPAAARGERTGAIGSPAPQLRGWGSRGRPDVAPPTPSPLCPKAHHTAGADRAHTRRTHAPVPPTCRTPGGAQRDPPPTRRGEARAAVGNERHTAPPRGRRTRPRPTAPRGEVGGGMFCPRALGSLHGGHCALGRGSSWGVRYPKAPSRIAREGFLTEGSPPLTRIVSLLRAHGGAPRATSPQLGWEGSAVQVGGPPTQERLRGRGQRRAPRPVPCKASPVSLDDEGNRHASPTASTPPKREPTHGTHTHHRGGDPRRTPGLRETTPPLGLRHLSDDLERSRSTTEDPTRHARAPTRGGTAQQRYSPPHRGEGRSRSTRREGEARASAVSEDPRPPLTPPEAGDRRPKVRARGRNPAPAFLPLPDGQGEKVRRGAPRTDREEQTRSPGTPVPRLARLRPGPGEHDHTTSIG